MGRSGETHELEGTVKEQYGGSEMTLSSFFLPLIARKGEGCSPCIPNKWNRTIIIPFLLFPQSTILHGYQLFALQENHSP